MFFYISKLAWTFVQPSRGLVLLFLLGFLAIWRGRWRAAAVVLATGAILYIAAGFTPLAKALLLPLEQRYARNPAPQQHPLSGIIVLGGGFDPEQSAAREQIVLTEAGERMIEALRLAREYPEAKIVFAGGESALEPTGRTEASTARQFFIDMGVSPNRLVSEDRSRNTYENARFTADILQAKPGERWLLVTSAFHMPRAVGCFRTVGLNVEPWPVDYRTSGWSDLHRVSGEPSEGLRQLDTGFKEWLGLIAYRLTGRTDRLLP